MWKVERTTEHEYINEGIHPAVQHHHRCVGGPPPTEPDADGGPAAGRGVVFGGGTGGARRKRRIDTVTTAAKRGMLYILTFTTGGGYAAHRLSFILCQGALRHGTSGIGIGRGHIPVFYPQSPGEPRQGAGRRRCGRPDGTAASSAASCSPTSVHMCTATMRS